MSEKSVYCVLKNRKVCTQLTVRFGGLDFILEEPNSSDACGIISTPQRGGCQLLKEDMNLKHVVCG